MKSLSAAEIRKIWLDFFKSKGHSIEESASLVPINDPTLLWINAGVAPLKKYFDGSEKPNNPRMTNAQKCIRTNDIENVGLTARHHTFFEMLGNFSIGDYFKEEAIEYGFELLTKHYEFPLDKLYITYYPSDKDAFNKWRSLGVKEENLIPLKDNFWEIGEGPCGPDTEIFFDRGEKYDKRGKILLEQDIENDRFIEIWNIVFSQYNSKPNLKRDEYPELPSKNIDTGCGLERLCCVLQGVDTNYETDLFIDYIREIEKISNVKYEGQTAFKVVADHIRTLTFAISDGAVLSNEGRGYVLRRVLRRALKHAKKIGIDYPFMYTLVDKVVDKMKSFYPYLEDKKEIVKQIIKTEEIKFLETLSLGEKRIYEILNNKDVISGFDAFTLYDTFGFPIELTIEYALEKNKEVDLEGFKKEMEIQKQKSRNARADLKSMNTQNEEYLKFTEESEFVGYTKNSITTNVIAKFDNSVVLKETPFYATSGGQLHDIGKINEYEILDVIKMPNGQFLHVLNQNDLKVGELVNATIDLNYRNEIALNHSACHLLHKSLKLVLGDHVHQQGSQISQQFLRFDFNNYQNLTNEEILKVEKLVKDNIINNHQVIIKEMPIDEARKTGAEALFGEKYKDIVRVVNMEYSIELCGGTHVSNTSDIKNFAISSIESIGSGLYRITGVTGLNALDKLNQSLESINKDINQLIDKGNRIVSEAKKDGINLVFNPEKLEFREPTYNIIIRNQEFLSTLKEQIKDLDQKYSKELAIKALKDLSKFDSLIEGNKLVTSVENIEIDILKQLVDALLDKMKSGIVFLASVINNEKIVFVCKNNIGLHSGQIVKEAAIITKGNGGGRPDMANAGGSDISMLPQALLKVKEMIK